MKVTKKMLHKDLQPSFRAHNIMAYLNKKSWFRNIAKWAMTKALHGKNIAGLNCEERYLPSSEPGKQVRVRIYRPTHHDGGRLPAMLYIHAGGYILGCPEMAGDIVQEFINRRPCVVIAPDYRKAHTKPYPAGFSDCYDTLLWAKHNADDLNIDPKKFIVAGHSAGGGLTAAITLKNRDTQEVNIAFQMPFYPMIDDRQPSDPARRIQAPVWDTELNQIGWTSYLAEIHSAGSEVPAYAAPARNSDYRQFPPTITLVGTLEPFHQETVDYVKALENEDVEVAFREYGGCYHAFDLLCPKAHVSQEALRFALDSYADFYDRHLEA